MSWTLYIDAEFGNNPFQAAENLHRNYHVGTAALVINDKLNLRESAVGASPRLRFRRGVGGSRFGPVGRLR